MGEAELVRRAKDGDMAAFEQLISNYQMKIYHIAYHMLSNEQDAEDAAQEAMIKAYRYLGSFKEESGFYTWIYRITHNICLDMLRRRKRSLTHETDLVKKDQDGQEAEMQIVDAKPQPEEQLMRQQVQNEMQNAIAELKENYRVVLVMRDIEGMSYDDIAAVLEISAGTVKSRLNRARENLRKIVVKKYQHLLE
ncbi:MAG: sigma-70 family RNA polymerase sigma factor [Clostridia bacterium]|nr:sigma-70 family RNA polymerase sigma factor [Clostridia bacterium]